MFWARLGQTVSRHTRPGLVSVTLTHREKQRGRNPAEPYEAGGPGLPGDPLSPPPRGSGPFHDRGLKRDMARLGTEQCKASQPRPGSDTQAHRQDFQSGSDKAGKGGGRRGSLSTAWVSLKRNVTLGVRQAWAGVLALTATDCVLLDGLLPLPDNKHS